MNYHRIGLLNRHLSSQMIDPQPEDASWQGTVDSILFEMFEETIGFPLYPNAVNLAEVRNVVTEGLEVIHGDRQ